MCVLIYCFVRYLEKYLVSLIERPESRQPENINATESAVILPACHGLPTESNPFWVSVLELPESRQPENINATESAVILPACHGLPTESNPFWVSVLELPESRQPENINATESAVILPACHGLPTESNPFWVSVLELPESRQPENNSTSVLQSATMSLACPSHRIHPSPGQRDRTHRAQLSESRQLENINAIVNANILHACCFVPPKCRHITCMMFCPAHRIHPSPDQCDRICGVQL